MISSGFSSPNPLAPQVDTRHDGALSAERFPSRVSGGAQHQPTHSTTPDTGPLNAELSDWIIQEQFEQRQRKNDLIQILQRIDLFSIRDDLNGATNQLVPFATDHDLRDVLFRNALGDRPSSVASAKALRQLEWGTIEPLEHLRTFVKSGIPEDSALPAMLKLKEPEERELLQTLLLNSDQSTPVFVRTALQNFRDLDDPFSRTTLLKFVRHASDNGMIQEALDAGEALQGWITRDSMLRLNLSIFVHAPTPVQSFLHVIGAEFLPSRIVLESLTLFAFKPDVLTIRTLAAAVALTPTDPDLGARVIEEARRALDPAYYDRDPELYDTIGAYIMQAMHLPRPE